jgi:transposase
VRTGALEDYIRLALDLAGLVVLSQYVEDGRLVVNVAYANAFAVCPHCGRPTNKVHDYRPQRKRDLPLRGQGVTLVMWRRRFRCLWCLGRRRRPRTFSEPDPVCGLGPGGRARRTTQRLREQIGREPPHQTVKRVAEVYGVGQRFVRECFAGRAEAAIAAAVPTGYTPRVLGMDEFSMKRGRRYETVFCDLEAPRVLEVVEGRDRQAVQPYLESLREPRRVAVVVIDMSETYRQVALLRLPGVVIVADRFHVVRRVGEALDRVRRRLQGQERKGRRDRLYRLRYALLAQPADWSEKERLDIEGLFVAYPEFKTAWERKEEFRLWYESADRATAEVGLRQWEAALRSDGMPEYLALFAQGSLLSSWRQEALNYFDYRYTNAYVAGKNNRTKQLQRQAYGYRNRANLRLRILLPVA